MSKANNRDSLVHYRNKVWLTRPLAKIPPDGQRINICVEYGDDFAALEQIVLKEDGIYYRKDEPLGSMETEAFRRYIDKLAGTQGMGETELFDRVCEIYEESGTFKAVVKELDISKERVRRILISCGMLKDDLITNIAFLYDEGKGKSIAEIARELGVSEDIVQKNMAYPRSR